MVNEIIYVPNMAPGMEPVFTSYVVVNKWDYMIEATQVGKDNITKFFYNSDKGSVWFDDAQECAKWRYDTIVMSGEKSVPITDKIAWAIVVFVHWITTLGVAVLITVAIVAIWEKAPRPAYHYHNESCYNEYNHLNCGHLDGELVWLYRKNK